MEVCDPCWTCRNRRIQCDQSGTPCAKCEKAGLECFDKRPFRWVKGVAIRGKMQGRSFEGKAGDSSSALKPVRSPVKKPRTPVSGETLHSALQDPSTSHLDHVSKYYIDYCESRCEAQENKHTDKMSDNERICKLFIVYDSDKNPLRSLIPYGMKEPILQKAILALAARHHVNSGQPFHQLQAPTSPDLINANRDALLFKHQAMEALSRALGNANSDSSKKDTTVASIFLLIFLDLLESGSDGWNFHLEGAKSLISSRRLMGDTGINDGPGQTIQEIRGFIAKQIHLIETLGATFLRPKLLSEFISADEEDAQSQEAIEKSFLGCPEYLLKAIQFLSNERDTIAASKLDQAAIQTHIQDTTAMLSLIQNFDCYAWVSSLQTSSQSTPNKISNLCTLSQAYKIGASIYGRRVLDALTDDVTLQDDLLSELLGLIDALKEDEALFKCILWAIFVAGLECRTQAQRDFLVECLEKFWVATSCLNVVNAANILRDYWQQEDKLEVSSRWIFDIGRLGRDWLLI
ncbi:uncharacterized protein N7511_004890 [Penicillium nucicola]|uniref:uncharacterized protein n=1 Tax=Penicillium nucicola TaxID=1850975 RepID=UPI002544E8DB|nr:uncharacterized protein N7511_004890 [Penicillium nucicola]KAJ5767274.1 hypothetical protein N7511_004890 [Penicillium nucicola]